MGIRDRYLEPAITPVLPRKMVFIGGPRQVGKTPLALSLIGKGAERNPSRLLQLGRSAVGGAVAPGGAARGAARC